MYTQRRYPLKKVLIWTKRETIFFFALVTIATVLYEVLNLKWMQLPFTPVGLIGTAVAFMVGFQNNAAYARIWEARKIWGGIVNVSRTFIITVRDSFHLHHKNANHLEREELQIITHRHIAWLTALRYAMRSKKSWETTYEKLQDLEVFNYNVPENVTSLEDELEGYLSTEELAYVLTKDNKPNAIIGLQSQHLRRLCDEDKIWDFSLLKLQRFLEEMTALQGKSERIKNFPYPKQYGSIGYHFVHIFMWLLPLAIIPHFHEIGNDLMKVYKDSYSFIGEYFIWVNIPFTVIVIWVFNTMLRIGLAGENPFEGSPNDVPISNISRGITRDILQLIDEDENNIPQQFENPNHIQM
ncbi:bestrophin family protein [Crocinitomix algicola]|uniref:bestrophin family protein n=1 Tax=Crocinitomix algicola TaxID=1740263 RepID=UPI0008732B1B|nr:bestrophin family ion channel [Crocinitomix algicola]